MSTSSPSTATRFLDNELLYDGGAIRSQWAYLTCGLRGDSVVAFVGPCDIPTDNIVDHEDVLAGAKIYSPRMLHFIVEHFDGDLLLAVHRQRLFMTICKEWLETRLPAGVTLRRVGDDLFDEGRKLSISIATATRVSTKIHVGLNIRTEGVPVPAAGLEAWGVNPRDMAEAVMAAYAAEIAGIQWARSKVRGVD